MTQDEELFSKQCNELGGKILDMMMESEKTVVACVLPGVLASVMTVLKIPRATVIEMLDSALEDIKS